MEDSLIEKLEALREVAIAGGNPEVMLDKCIRIVERYWQAYVPPATNPSGYSGDKLGAKDVTEIHTYGRVLESKTVGVGDDIRVSVLFDTKALRPSGYSESIELVRELHESMKSEAGVHYRECDLGERVERFLASGIQCEISDIKVLDLSGQEIARLKAWFENKSGKNVTEFWEEAFNAGIKTAGYMSQPTPEGVGSARIVELQEELTEYKDSIDFRWECDRRAIKLWQEATGRELTWPDHADLCVWLLQQLETECKPEPLLLADCADIVTEMRANFDAAGVKYE